MSDLATCIARLELLKRDLNKIAANEMVNFALDNLRAQSWNGVPWAPRKPSAERNTGRALLIDTGRGKRSIKAKPMSSSAELTTIYYMQYHNDGVHKTVSSRSRKGKTFSRKVDLPKRQFTGVSAKQTERIENIIVNKLIQALS